MHEDILDQMDFEPIVADDCKEMDKRITPHQNAHLQSLTSQHRIPSFAKAHFLQRSTEKVRLLIE
jgi:hypothetical protein